MNPGTRQRIRYLRTSDGVQPRRAAAFEQLVAAVAPREPFFLLGMSQGAAVVIDHHLSNLFDKLGVWTRAQAIVLARDHGLRP